MSAYTATIRWNGTPPDTAAIADLHHRAHFIANSVTTEVVVEQSPSSLRA